jgi:hypothetical protein
MSNLTLFQSGNTLPAHLRQTELDPITRALMGNNTKRISIKSGVFRMIVGGQEVAVNEDRAMNVVVVRAAEHTSRMFYAGKFKDGENAKPTCWSADSVTPHESIKNPQAKTCANCPQNIKGSGDNDSRACRFQRRVAVVLEHDIYGDIYAMSVPATSLFGNGEGRKMPLQQYARFLGGHGIGINAVVTEMRFDTNSTAPKLTFSAVRPLEAEEWEHVRARMDDPIAVDACTMTVAQLDDSPETPATESEPEPEPAPAPPPRPAPAAKPATPAPKAGGFKVTTGVPAPAAPTPKATPKPVAKPAAATVATPEPEEEAPAEPQVRQAPARPSVPNVNAILEQWGDDLDD